MTSDAPDFPTIAPLGPSYLPKAVTRNKAQTEGKGEEKHDSANAQISDHKDVTDEEEAEDEDKEKNGKDKENLEEKVSSSTSSSPQVDFLQNPSVFMCFPSTISSTASSFSPSSSSIPSASGFFSFQPVKRTDSPFDFVSSAAPRAIFNVAWDSHEPSSFNDSPSPSPSSSSTTTSSSAAPHSLEFAFGSSPPPSPVSPSFTFASDSFSTSFSDTFTFSSAPADNPFSFSSVSSTSYEGRRQIRGKRTPNKRDADEKTEVDQTSSGSFAFF